MFGVNLQLVINAPSLFGGFGVMEVEAFGLSRRCRS